MTLAKISLYLGTVGGLALLISFLLAVVHTPLLAAGRRTLTLPAGLGSSRAPAPAGAGVGTPGASSTTITFGPAGRGTAATGAGATAAAGRTTAGSIGHAFTWIA